MNIPVADQGRGPLIFRSDSGPKGGKFFFLRPPSPLSEGLDLPLHTQFMQTHFSAIQKAESFFDYFIKEPNNSPSTPRVYLFSSTQPIVVPLKSGRVTLGTRLWFKTLIAVWDVRVFATLCLNWSFNINLFQRVVVCNAF